jgi:hypothetical protein
MKNVFFLAEFSWKGKNSHNLFFFLRLVFHECLIFPSCSLILYFGMLLTLINVGFMVDKISVGQIFLQGVPFSPANHST